MKINVICVSMLFNAGIQSELSSYVPFHSIANCCVLRSFQKSPSKLIGKSKQL